MLLSFRQKRTILTRVNLIGLGEFGMTPLIYHNGNIESKCQIFFLRYQWIDGRPTAIVLKYDVHYYCNIVSGKQIWKEPT